MMARTELVPAEDVLEEELADPALLARWQELALARAVAIWLVRFRAKHGLSQERLAARLGVSQPVVARLESGEHVPRMETLLRLSETLGMSLRLDVTPPPREPVAKPPEDATVEHTSTPGGARLQVVAA